MHKFSEASLRQLHTCHEDIQAALFVAIKICPMDFTILEGHRSLKRQRHLFRANKTQIDGVNKIGKHNKCPSEAVDLAPYPIDWEDLDRFRYLAGYILGCAQSRGIRMRWGGDWDNDGSFKDQRFHDLGHFELHRNGQ